MVKVSIKNIDGYNVVVYWGFWKNHLLIEDYEYDSNWGSIFHNTLLSGELPNGKQVTVTLSSGSASFKVDSLNDSTINTYGAVSNDMAEIVEQIKDNKKDQNDNPSDIDNGKSNDDALEIIKRINEDLLMLSCQKDSKKIKQLKAITQEDYQKLLKCSNVNKEDILKIEKMIVDMFLVVDNN